MNEQIFTTKNEIRRALALLSGNDVTDEALNRASDHLEQAQHALATELRNRNAQRVRDHQATVVGAHIGATDRIGRGRSPVTLPGYHKGRIPPNKGHRYPPTPPSTEEIIRMLGCCATDAYGERTRALILVLWRAGLRIGEALRLTEADLNPQDSSIYVAKAKHDSTGTVGIDAWVWPQIAGWMSYRATLPFGPLFCVISGPTAGKAWSASDVRKKLPLLAAKANVRRRVAPHQLRHALAVELLQEDVNVLLIQRQLRHKNLAITTEYFRGLPASKTVEAMRSRPIPQISALSVMDERRQPIEIPERAVTHV
jgi:integrase